MKYCPYVRLRRISSAHSILLPVATSCIQATKWTFLLNCQSRKLVYLEQMWNRMHVKCLFRKHNLFRHCRISWVDKLETYNGSGSLVMKGKIIWLREMHHFHTITFVTSVCFSSAFNFFRTACVFCTNLSILNIFIYVACCTECFNKSFELGFSSFSASLQIWAAWKLSRE